MNPEDTYRQVTLPGPRGDDRGGRGGRGGRDDKLPSWSARRTALTVALLLVVVVGVFWWASLEQQDDPKWWEPQGQKQLGEPIAAKPIDLESTDKALDALSGWERMSWVQKTEATRVISQVFELGGVDYVTYVEVNRDIIREHLEMRKRTELIRRTAADDKD